MKVKSKWLAIGALVAGAAIYSISAWATRVNDLYVDYYSDATFSEQVGSYSTKCFSGSTHMEGVKTAFIDSYTTPCGEDWPKTSTPVLPWMGPNGN